MVDGLWNLGVLSALPTLQAGESPSEMKWQRPDSDTPF